MRLALLYVSVTIALAGCTLPQVVPEALNTEFKPTGGVVWRERSASFDATRVRAPNCNLAKRTDGSWGGTLQDRPVDVSVTDTHIRGVDIMMTREETRKGHIVITGQFIGKIARFEIDSEQVMVRTASVSKTLPGRIITPGGAAYGPLHELELRGEAGLENPPWPQFAFALLAAF